MQRMYLLSLIVLLAIQFLCCMTTKESFLKKGAQKLTPKQIEQAYRGNTLKAANRSAYYREDGIRRVYVPSHGDDPTAQMVDRLKFKMVRNLHQGKNQLRHGGLSQRETIQNICR